MEDKKSQKQKSLTIKDLQTELDIRLKKEGLEPLEEVEPKLKASECKIVFEDCRALRRDDKTKFKEICNNQPLGIRQTYPYVLATTCDGWAGNSGGGYISLNDKKSLYGTCSFGWDSFKDYLNDDYIASSKQFKTKIAELIKQYPPAKTATNPVEQPAAQEPITNPVSAGNIGGNAISSSVENPETNVPEAPVNNQPSIPVTDVATAVTGIISGATNGVEETSGVNDLINDLTTETNDLAVVLEGEAENVPTMTDNEVLGFVNTYVTYQVKYDQLQKLKKSYEEAKARAQSKENRLLTAATIAATGVGGMELAQGLAEQRADKVAEQSMNAYTSTMRCRYGNGKQVKAGPEEIELPGGNDENMTKLRNEYFALAADLKERKEALGMKPGIESETILDKSQIGLYDEENIGITDGAYASLYRANMLNSEKDKQLIEEEKETSQNRVIGGATTAGTGVVGGIVGDRMINGKTAKKRNEN